MKIYIDGSCKQNPGGPGGFSIVVLDNNDNIINLYQEFFNNTTNNRMELSALLWAFLKYGTKDGFNIPIVYSDSSYVINIFNSWMETWANNNWLKSDK